MKTDIEDEMLAEPSGAVRGVVTAFAEMKGKQKRIAHAVLLTAGGADVTLDVPKKVAVGDISELANLLNEFAMRVQSKCA